MRIATDPTDGAKPERAIRSTRVVLPDGVRAASVVVGAGRVIDVVAHGAEPPGIPVEELGSLALMPGLVDSHVHVNEPGRTEWEGFDTATRAAAAGGITTIVDMPLNCIPVTTTRSALRVKREAVGGLLHVDVGFWGGVVPGNAAELDGLVDDGALGFKCFLVHSGIDEFPDVSDADLDRAMPILARRGVPLLVHAECADHLRVADPASRTRYASWLDSRPAASEEHAVARMIALCRRHRGPVHIVHLSAASALPAIAAARAEGLPITIETCPHYLTLCAEEVPDGSTQYKCAPPIRERDNRERLWDGLRAGAIDLVVSDHSPCTPHLKLLGEGDFLGAWGGISSVQLTLPVVWTQARARGFGIEAIARWMCERPAVLAGIARRKGRIARGADADLVAWDPEAGFTVDASRVLHRHKLTPYDGHALLGVVRRTWLRGAEVFAAGSPSPTPRGRFVARDTQAGDDAP